MFENAIADIRRYYYEHGNICLLPRMMYLIFRQDLWAILIFRFGKWANYECRIPVLRHFFKTAYFFLKKVSEMFLGVGIWPESEIGPGLNCHYGGTFIKAKIGKNCTIGQHVIIGHLGGFRGGGVPTLGDNVYVGAGAKVLGEVTIGDNVKIGANAVVLTDVPDNMLAVDVPAKVRRPKERINSSITAESGNRERKNGSG